MSKVREYVTRPTRNHGQVAAMKGIGNAINVRVAAEFVGAVLDVIFVRRT